MRKWLCLLLGFALASALTSCADTGAVKSAASAQAQAEASDAAQASDAAEASDTAQAQAEASATAEAWEASDAAQAWDAAQASATAELQAQASATQARDLSADELRQWSEFLSQVDCYGFLMSSYKTPLDADLAWVFYDGAGVGEYPTPEMVDEFLTANGLEEAYTDITFIPYDAANEVLQRRAGYTLEHFRLVGNDIPLYYSQKYAGYFHMAGDTNRMLVECVSGRLNPDGSVFLKSREGSWTGEPGDEFTSTFETTLKPDAQGRGMTFDSNAVTGGWLSWADE